MGTRLTAALAGIGLATVLTACGDTSAGGSVGAVDEQKLKGASFTVSSKDFTESVLLGKITRYLLEAHGATVNDKTKIQGSVNTRTALTSKQVDMYWEYTGTGWITYLKNTKPIPDPRKQYEEVKKADLEKNGIAWLEPAPLNNTYAFAIRAEAAKKLGVSTMSNVAELARSKPAEATFCIESEFSTRDDGFPGLQKAYGFTAPKSNVTMLETGVVYTETAKGKACNFGEVFATDGRIAALKLTVLEDDQKFFPFYNAALTLRKETLDKYPALAEVVNPVAAKLDDKTMTSLNAQVDAEGLPVDDVAKDWLREQGFVQ